MDLSIKSKENIEFMIDEIKRMLKMASAGAMNGSNFNEEMYEDIKDIYDLIKSKTSFSVSEMEALVSELGKLRKGNNTV